MKCIICKQKIIGYGNNPEPYKSEGKCCDSCNSLFVIPSRLKLTIEKIKGVNK